MRVHILDTSCGGFTALAQTGLAEPSLRTLKIKSACT